jgi:hypothetical protein
MTKEQFYYRFTHLRKCDCCGQWSHLTRPVDFGIDVEDVCIRCMVKNQYRPDIRFLRREESFVTFLMMVISMSAGVVFGIAIVFDFLK